MPTHQNSYKYSCSSSHHKYFISKWCILTNRSVHTPRTVFPFTLSFSHKHKQGLTAMRCRVALTAAHRSSRLSMTRMKPTPDAATLQGEKNIHCYSNVCLCVYVCKTGLSGGLQKIKLLYVASHYSNKGTLWSMLMCLLHIAVAPVSPCGYWVSCRVSPARWRLHVIVISPISYDPNHWVSGTFLNRSPSPLHKY